MKIFYTNLMLQHYFHMSSAYYKFDNQMYCIQHTLLNIFSYCLLHFTNPILHNIAAGRPCILLNIFSYCLLHFTNPILHNIAIRPLIHMGLSDNPTQKNLPKFCFLFLSKTIYMYKANITLLYLMCAVEG